MRTKTLGVAIAALGTLVASGQSPTPRRAENRVAYKAEALDGGADAVRLFYLTHSETPQEVQEFVNVIRTMTDIQRVFAYAPRRAISLRGTSDQVAVAEWLFSRLDNPVDAQTAKPAAYEFPGPTGAVDAVRVFYFVHNETPQDLQRMINLIRTTTDIQRIFPYAARGAIALRGTSDQMALAEWLVGRLDKAVITQTNRVEAYAPPTTSGRRDAVRLFFFADNETPEDLQQMINLIRTTTDIQRIFPYAARRAIALRGTTDQMALAEWLVGQLETTANQQTRPK